MNKNQAVIVMFLALCTPSAAWQEPGTRSGAGRIITLQEAVRLVLARSAELSLAEAESAKAGQALREIRSLNRVQVVAGTGLAYNNGFPLSIEGAAPSIIHLGLSQPILSSKNRNLIREAEEGNRASLAGIDAARNGLAARTALLYSELHRARRAIPLLEEQRESTANSQKVAEALLQAGNIRPLDLSLARVATANVEQAILAVRERARLAEASLHELTGIPESETLLTEPPRVRIEMRALSLEALYRDALETLPEIREAEAALRSREFHVQAEKAERYPQVNIVSQYALFSHANNYEEYFNRFTRNNYLLGLSIQVPLFDGLRSGARVAQSRSEADAARMRLERLKSDLKMNLERGMSDLRVAGGALELARIEVAAVEEELDVGETLAEAGRIEPRELAGVRTRLLGKRLAAGEAELVQFERQVELLRTIGTAASTLQ